MTVKLTRAQITDMCKLQDALNTLDDKNWRDTGREWFFGAVYESMLFANNFSWKWWKPETPIVAAKVKLGLASVWQFALSDRLVDHKIERIADVYDSTCVSVSLLPPPMMDSLQHNIIPAINAFVALAASEQSCRFSVLIAIGNMLQLSGDELYATFVAKNTLNTFRLKNGLGDGTYRDVWDGVSDSEITEDALANNPLLTGDELLAILQAAYDKAA